MDSGQHAGLFWSAAVSGGQSCKRPRVWTGYVARLIRRPIEMTLIYKCGEINKSFPGPYRACMSLPIDLQQIIRYIDRFEQDVKTPEGRALLRQYGAL